jgi:hypothetical protein
VFIAVDVPVPDPLHRSSLIEYVDGLCSELSLEEAELLRADTDFDGKWTFIMCQASFEASFQQMNHWVPALVEEDVGEQLYQAVTHLQDWKMRCQPRSWKSPWRWITSMSRGSRLLLRDVEPEDSHRWMPSQTAIAFCGV